MKVAKGAAEAIAVVGPTFLLFTNSIVVIGSRVGRSKVYQKKEPNDRDFENMQCRTFYFFLIF